MKMILTVSEMLRICFLICLVLFSSAQAMTEERHTHGTHTECKLPQSTSDIITCAMKFHPSVKRMNMETQVTNTLTQIAEQSPNPTISGKYLKDDSDDSDNNSIETSLSFPIETGNKRSSRVSLAKAKQLETNTRSNVELSNIKIDTILKLHRLRQINVEKRSLDVTFKSLGKIINKLKKLPRLSVQQEASLTLFELASNDLRFKASVLYEKERKIEHSFHISTAHSLNEISPFLPKIPKRWPKIGGSQGDHKKSLEVQSYLAKETIGKEALMLERANAWSNINIGPSLSVENSDGEKTTSIGINIRFDLPLFHLNNGGKLHAKSLLAKAQQNTKILIAQNIHERIEQLKVYSSTLSVLKSTMKIKDVILKYKRIHKLYQRGVVSKSVFLESQKQKINYIKNRHEREMAALSALWSLYQIDGKVLKVKI
jgi:cobalt-zinc-cadmium efflux system outer membrane protein